VGGADLEDIPLGSAWLEGRGLAMERLLVEDFARSLGRILGDGGEHFEFNYN
jgi:hypothetical protein